MDRQYKKLRKKATVMGSMASPNEKPNVAIANAFPREATNHLAIDTDPIWLNIPCPEKRSKNINIGKAQKDVTNDIKKQVKANMQRNITPKVLALYLSVKAPTQTITIAEHVVLSA